MLINPKEAIEKGWITGVDDFTPFVQPNAIDFTLDSLSKIRDGHLFLLSEKNKVMRGVQKVQPWTLQEILKPSSQTHLIQKGFDVHNSKETFFVIDQNKAYDGMSNMYLTLPKGVACKLIVRSTLNRNGLFLTSGLYDSGFKGAIGFLIHNRSGTALIAPGTRVGQIAFYTSDSAELYEGGYNHEQGTHYTEKDDSSQLVDLDSEEPKDLIEPSESNDLRTSINFIEGNDVDSLS